ncbi:MAG: DegT/DnrJ/EryC1/StrS family aminotransferase, partial [Patescibacteria group bacterium]
KIAIGKDGFPFNSPHYKGSVSYEKGICPVTERMHERELIIHELVRPPLSQSDLDDAAAAFRKIYENRSELV